MPKKITDVVSAVNLPAEIPNADKILQYLKDEIRPTVDYVIEILMFFRGEPFSLSGKIYDEANIKERMMDIYNGLSFQEEKLKHYYNLLTEDGYNCPDPGEYNFQKFTQEAKTFYDIFSGELATKKNGDKISKPSNYFYPILFRDKMTKGYVVYDIPYLICTDLFPIKVYDSEIAKSITGEIARKIKSFEKIQKNRKKEEKDLIDGKTLKEAGLDSGMVETMLEFCQEMLENDTYFEQFSKRNLQSISRFIKRNLKEIREVYNKYGKDFVFEEKDLEENKIKTGYGVEFVNVLYSKYPALWMDSDIVPGFVRNGEPVDNCVLTDRQYISLAMNYFKFIAKKYVNISKFEDTGKYPCLLLGNRNYIKFKLTQEAGEICIDMTDLLSENRKDRISIKVKPNGYFNDFNIIDENKNGYTVTYNTARASLNTEIIETVYAGEIKEPRIRYDVYRSRFYVDFYITEVESSNDMLEYHSVDREKKLSTHKELSNFFRTSYGGVGQAKSSSLPLEKFNVIGVDLGFNPIAAIAAYSVEKHKDGVDIGKEKIKYSLLSTHKAKNVEKEDLQRIIKLDRFICSTKSLIHYARRHLQALEDRKLGKKVFDINIGYAEMKCGDLLRDYTEFESVQQYLDYIVTYLGDIDPKEWKTRHNQKTGKPIWPVVDLVQHAKSEFSKMKSAYSSAVDKRDYVRNRNFVCTKDLEKIRVVRSMIDLLKSYTFLGLCDKEKNSIEGFAKNLYKYQDGLRKFFSKNIASIIVHHALKNKASVIFVEDLDTKVSHCLSKDENITKSVWSVSTICEYLEKFAKKHMIVVSYVDPTMTSQIDSDTGIIGLRDDSRKEKLYVEVDNGTVEVVDSDINAAKNVAIRGLLRHSNIPLFKCEQVSEDKYLFSAKNVGKRRIGSMLMYIWGPGSYDKSLEYVLFTKNGNGTLIPESISKKQAEEQKKKNGKRKYWDVEVIRSGSSWYLRDEQFSAALDEYKARYESGLLQASH